MALTDRLAVGIALVFAVLVVAALLRPAPSPCDFTIDTVGAPCWFGTAACPIPCDAS